MRVPLPEARVVRWLVLVTLVVLAACSEEQPTELPTEPTPLATHSPNCPLPTGTSLVTINVVDTNGDEVVGATVVLVHPVCGPVQVLQDGAVDNNGSDGAVTFTGLPKNELFFAHARDGVNAAGAQLAIFPPSNPSSALNLADPPTHAAALTGPRGSSPGVTLSSYLAAIAAPPIKTNNSPSGVSATIVLPIASPLLANFVGLGPSADAAVGAITKFGGTELCTNGQIPWLVHDPLCTSGAGVGFATGIDAPSSDAELIYDPGCILEALANGDDIVAASASCDDAVENQIDLIATPLVCDVTDIGTVDDDIGDGGKVDIQGLVQFAVMGEFAVGGGYPIVPTPSRIAYWGSMVVSADASMRLKSKTNLDGGGSQNSSTTFSVTTGGQCAVTGSSGGSTTVSVFCALVDGTVKFAIVESNIESSRLSHAFRLEEVGKEFVPDADQAGGESFAPVPPAPTACTWESDNSRLSVRL